MLAGVHAACKRATNIHQHHYITHVTPQLLAAVLTLTFIAKHPPDFFWDMTAQSHQRFRQHPLQCISHPAGAASQGLFGT